MKLRLTKRQAKLLAILIREHLHESIYSVRRTEVLDRDLRMLLPDLDKGGE